MTGDGPNRRALLAAAAAGAIATPAATLAQAGRSRWSKALIVNALGGLADPNADDYGDQKPPAPANAPDVHARSLSPRVLRDAHASGVNAINVTLGYVSGPADPYESSIKDIGETDATIRRYPNDLLKVLTAADILRAKREGKIGLIYGFQNAAQVGDKLDRIDTFADLGVRVIQLTYNPANQIGDGSMAPLNRGLTPFGRQVVERLNANRVMVDLSHSGERTCLDAIAVSKAPISINHTGCRALVDLPRNKTDAELRGVAEKGGFVGIYFMPFLNISGHAHASDVVAHIDHALKVCGEDHVGVGTDGTITGIDDLHAYQAHLAKEIAARRAAGISATGERPDTYPFVVDLRGPGQFYKLADLLSARGHSSAVIEKVLGRNFVRYAYEVWGA